MNSRYSTFQQVVSEQASNGALTGVHNAKGLIRYVVSSYTSSYSQVPKIFRYGKYLVYIYFLCLVVFSFNATMTLPSRTVHFEYTKQCIQEPTNKDCSTVWENPMEKEDTQYIDTSHQTWNLYSNILMFLLFVTYFPYKIFQYYKLVKSGDISLAIGVWRGIKIFLIIQLVAFTWWLGAFTGSLSLVTYFSIFPIPYELFGTFDIPWLF